MSTKRMSAGRGPSRTTKALVALVVALGALTGLPASPASAAPLPGTALPMQAARAIAVDPGSGRVFVAGDNTVAVRNPAGAPVATVPNMFGAKDLAAGGGSIYALLASTSSIARINPTTLAVTGTWSVAPVTDVHGLAFAGGRIWTTGEDDFDTFAVSVEPSTGTVTPHEFPYWWNRMNLESTPGAPDLLVGGQIDVGPGTVHTFDVSGGGFTPIAEATTSGIIWDLAVNPAGTRVLLAEYGDVTERNLPGLTSAGISYPLGEPATSVTAASVPNGSLVLAAGRGFSDEPDIGVFRAGAPAALYKGQVRTTELETFDGGVALAPGGTRAYAVRTDWHPSAPHPAAELVVVDLAPQVSGVSPRVVGTRGGGRITVNGAGLALTGVRVGGQPTTGATGSATARSVVVPALPEGNAPVVVGNLMGVETTSPVPAVVRDLGPFRDSTGFADRQYRDFLGRAASAGDIAAADSGLATGGSPGLLPTTLARSAAFSGPRAPVIRLYQAIFLRPPDTAGLDYWMTQIRQGRSLTWVASAMAAAPEFRNRYGTLTNRQFVEQIYQNVLGRPAEPAGRDYWVGVLDGGRQRGVMVIGFSQSPEYQTKMTKQVEITDVYLGMLGRAPSSSQLAAGLALESVPLVAAGIVTSTEYRTRIG